MSDKEKIEKWLKEHDGEDYCEYCRYYQETCPGIMRGGADGLIETACINEDVSKFLDTDALLDDIKEERAEEGLELRK